MLYISKHTLNGEMFRQTSHEIESKFYVLGDQGIAVTSFIFNGYSSPMSQNKYALEFVVPLQHLQLYVSFYPIILNRIPFFVRKLVAFQKKVHSSSSVFFFMA